MSLVLVVKDKDRYVLGADKQSSIAGTADHNCVKIWRVSDFPEAVMGGVGSARASQIIQYAPLIDKNEIHGEGIDTAFIVNVLVPAIAGTLKHNGVSCDIPEGGSLAVNPNSFLFAVGDKAWMIGHDFSVSEVGDYLAIGSGADIATGALFATPDKNPFERIVTCIDAAAENTLYVDHGVDLLATKMYPRDKDQILEALNPELAEVVKAEAKAKREKEKKTAAKKKTKKVESSEKGVE